MPTRIDLLIKLDELPTETVKVMGNGHMFVVGEAPGPRFVVTLNKKSWKRLTTGAEQWPRWLAVISGKFGECVGESLYRLENAGLMSMVERKPKTEASHAQTEGEREETQQGGEEEDAPALEGTATTPTPTVTPSPAQAPSAAAPAPKAPQPAKPAPTIPRAWRVVKGKRKPPAYVPQGRVFKEQQLLAPKVEPVAPARPPTTKELWAEARRAVPEVAVRRPLGGGPGSGSSGSR